MTNIAPIIQTLPVLSRIARAALDWNQVEAGVRTGIPKISLGRFEILKGNLNAIQCGLLLDAFSAEGVNFSVEGKAIHVTIDAETIASSMKKLESLERRRADYKGSR